MIVIFNMYCLKPWPRHWTKLFICISCHLHYLVAQMIKNLPPMKETNVRSLGEEDSLEKILATHSSILAWRIQWTEEPGRLQSTGSQRVRHNLAIEQQIIVMQIVR